jgi:hypothetical protein
MDRMRVLLAVMMIIKSVVLTSSFVSPAYLPTIAAESIRGGQAIRTRGASTLGCAEREIRVVAAVALRDDQVFRWNQGSAWDSRP